MLERLKLLCSQGGTLCAVSPQNWLFLGSYKKMRRKLLSSSRLNIVADLGPAAFNEMNWWAARTALTAITEQTPKDESSYLAINADTDEILLQSHSF